MRIPLLWLFTACGGGDEPTAEPALEPSPYVAPEAVVEPAEVSLPDVQATLQATLDQLRDIHARPLALAYDDVMASQSDRCPNFYSTADGSYWNDQCATEDGTTFAGYVFISDQTDVFDPANNARADMWSVFGAATVGTASGDRLELGGSAFLYQLRGQGWRYHATSVLGTFVVTGPAADGTWLRDQVSPDLNLAGYDVDGVPDRSLTVDGGISGLPGGWAVAFDNNTLTGRGLGSSCDAEVSGVVGVRSPDGVWVDVLFDGPVEGQDPSPPATCDGCGDAFAAGVRIGEVCVDPSALIAWGESPW